MSLILLGNDLKYKKSVQNYIIEHPFSQIYYFNSVEFEIEKLLKEEGDTLILTNKKNYPVILKVLATLTDDQLIADNNQLILQNTSRKEKNSFLISFNNTYINVALMEKHHMPTVLLTPKEEESIHVFEYDLETSLLLLKPIFSTHNITYTAFENEGGWVVIKTSSLSSSVKEKIKETLHKVIIQNNICEYCVRQLIENKKTITFAESCTGGLLASHFTQVAGVSRAFGGAVVTYSNEIKNSWLGVDQNTLDKFSAVSEQSAKEMLVGALSIAKSHFAVAISGIAGPTGGTDEKPIGTVYVGVTDGNEIVVERLLLKGTREEVQYQSMMHAMRVFIKISNFF